MRGWAILAGGVLFALAARAQEPEGWAIVHSENGCIASGPVADNAKLLIDAMPPQYFLLFQSPDFPVERITSPVTVRIDDTSEAKLEAMGSHHVYGVAIVPAIGIPLRAASKLSLIVDGKTYTFAVAHAAEAMDMAGQCAGGRSLLESWGSVPKPIDGAPGWLLEDDLQGTDQCSVRRNSDQIDVSLVYGEDGVLILIAGRSDWAKWGGDFKASIAIDDGGRRDVKVYSIQNIVFYPVKDRAVEQRLMKAKTLAWYLPWGSYRGEVEGLDVAAEALRQCNASKAAAKRQN